MKRKNSISWHDAWQRLLSGEVVAACRMSDGAGTFLRNQAWRIGRQLIDSGIGVYRTYSLA